ncbi:insulinase family protein [bacterium]|nr:insulinase family protein [bacterium]
MKYKTLIILPLLFLLVSCLGHRELIEPEPIVEPDIIPAYTPPASEELTPVILPDIQTKVLDNGLKIIVIPHNELPVAAFELMIKSGSLNDPLGKAGLASFTASLLRKGTETRSATEIAEEIDFIGGDLSAGSSWDRTYVTCQVLKRYFDIGLDLMSDIVLHPVFKEDEIERLCLQSISSYKMNLDDPGNLADENFASFLFGEHPFGFPSGGTDETIAAITRDEIVKFYESHYIPGNSMIVAAGDVEPAEVFKAVEAKFGDWKESGITKETLPELTDIEGYKILLVNKPDATQSQIRMGRFGVARSNPDVFPIILMNYIYGGGGFSSRLMKTVRSEMGLTYSIYSNFEMHLEPGAFEISTFTKNESVKDAITEILAQMHRMKADDVMVEELRDAQSYRTGSYPMRFETPAQIAEQVMAVELYELGDDYIETYRDKVQAVTVEQVRQAAEKYLDPDNLAIVVVGNKDEIYDQLAGFGEVQVVEIQ